MLHLAPIGHSGADVEMNDNCRGVLQPQFQKGRLAFQNNGLYGNTWGWGAFSVDVASSSSLIAGHLTMQRKREENNHHFSHVCARDQSILLQSLVPCSNNAWRN